MRKSIILIVALIASLNISAQTKEKQDSLNIPVFLVDGVEVQNIDNLDQKDIISVNVIYDSCFNKQLVPLLNTICKLFSDNSNLIYALLTSKRRLIDLQKVPF